MPTAVPVRITVLYDAFGGDAAMTKDWGYAALCHLCAGPGTTIEVGAHARGTSDRRSYFLDESDWIGYRTLLAIDGGLR